MLRSLEFVARFFTRNRGLKVLAVLLAALSWYYIRDITSFQQEIEDIPLNIALPDGWALDEISASSVSIVFRGSQADIRSLTKDQIRVDISAALKDGAPSSTQTLSRANISAPRAVQPVYINPSEIKITLDRESKKLVNVDVTRVGQTPDGYFLDGISVIPQKVTIYGPERRLNEVEYIRTEPVDLSGQISSFSNGVMLVAPRGNWKARMEVDTVTVNASIVERTLRRDFRNVPVKIMMPPGSREDYAISPRDVDISVKCRVDVVSNLTEKSVHAYVDYQALSDGDATEIPVEVTAAPGVTIMMVDPPVVRFSRINGAK